jgi:rhodanese-related sulfurtransferase
MFSISVQDLHELMKNPNFSQENLIVDVRTAEEHEAGHLPGAIHLPPDEFSFQIEALKAAKQVFVHCKSGGRSARACELLEGLGIKNAVNVEGGLEKWGKHAFPIDR